jgi:putative chitinase
MADNKLIVVDPNPKDNELVPLEKLTISVELETISKGRSILTSEGKLKNSQRKAKVNFINGSPVDGKNSLTTNYTEVNTKFNSNHKDLENLGITNIDIDFDSSYTPMVKIDFIDIRGNSIFEHGQDSTYNVFFELPYPIFKLTVKGYYGKAVSYCLHLRKWNSRFNSNTGNFEISCEFIGYTYAFLSDMLLGYLKGIVETKKGKEKLLARNVMSISELLQKTAELDLNNDKLKETINVKESTLIVDLLIKIGNIKSNLLSFIEGYSKINNVNSLYNNIINKPNDILGLYIITDDEPSLIDSYDSTFNDIFASQIKEFNLQAGSYNLNESSFRMNEGIKKYKFIFYRNSVPVSLLTSDGKTEIPIESQTSKEVGDSLKILGTSEVSLKNTKLIKVYNINDALTEINTIETQLKTKKDLLKNEIATEVQNNITKTYGNGFSPTIKNIINILITHVEIFMECLSDVAELSEKSHESDELKNVVSLDNSINDKTIYAFPKYYNSETGNEKWIGNDYPNIPEVIFINELLEGMINAVKSENEIINNITNSRNWYPVNIFDRTNIENINPYKTVETNGAAPSDFNRLIALRAITFLSVGNNFYTNNELTAMAKLEANNVYASIKNNIAKNSLVSLTKKSFIEIITSPKEYYKNKLSKDGVILKYIKGTEGTTNTSTYFAGATSVITTQGTNDVYAYDYLKDNNFTYLPLGGTNFNFNGENIVNNLDDENNIIISSDNKKENYYGLFKFINKEDYHNNEPYPSYGDSIISNIKDNPNYSLFKGTYSYNEKFIKNDKSNLYNFYYDYTREIEQGILTSKNLLSTDSSKRYLKNKNVIYKDLEKGNSEGNKYKGRDVYNEYYYESSNKGHLASNLQLNDIDIEDISYSNLKKDVQFAKTSLFGSEFYYRQETDEAKGFLFLNSIGFKSNSFDEDIILSVIENFKTSGYVLAPKAWVYYIGSLLWRMSKTYDPITFMTKYNSGIYSNIKFNGVDYKTEINDLDSNFKYRRLCDINDFEEIYPNYIRIDSDIYIPNKNQLLSTTENGNMNFIDSNDYHEISKFITEMPTQMNTLFINEFLKWVNGDWQKFKIELELFDSKIVNFNNTNLWDSNWSNFKDVPSINTDISYKNFNHKNYFVLRKAERSPVVSDYTKTITRDYMLTFYGDTEIVKNILSFLKEEIIIQNGTPKLWGANTRDFTVDKAIFDVYIDAFFNEIAVLNKADSQNASNKAEKEELFQTLNNEDIKLNLYRSIKAINDKWIGETISELCIIRENLINSFKFLNKSFKNIGDEFIINPQSITNYIKGFSNRSIADVISKLLADNGFDFIALPTFIDFKDEKELKTMFTPLDYNSMANTVGPSFICMYANRANTLDLGKGSNLGDSGFNINLDGNATIANGNSAFNNSDETIAAFLVKYGDDNQSIFKDIRLDQKEFSETEESLVIIDKLANTAAPGAKANIGQNLYNIYSTRSYSCEIECLGNAMIQPMMYFQLTNVPMFRGAYLILKASHNIKPNHMTTTFKGVRIAGIDVPLVTSETVSIGITEQFSDVDTTGVILSNTGIDNILTNSLIKIANITNQYLQAGILAIITKESNSTPVAESLYYSTPENLKNTFGDIDFPTLESAKPYVKNSVKTANHVYANENGNGDEASGDGYRYRGRGFNQITFKGTYKSIGDELKIDLVNNPDKLLEPEIASDANAIFFKNGLKSGLKLGSFKKYGVTKVEDINDTTKGTQVAMQINAGLGKKLNTDLKQIQENIKKKGEKNVPVNDVGYLKAISVVDQKYKIITSL